MFEIKGKSISVTLVFFINLKILCFSIRKLNISLKSKGKDLYMTQNFQSLDSNILFIYFVSKISCQFQG